MTQILGRIVTPNLPSAPGTPSRGEMYYDTSLNQLLYWNGSTWVAGSSGGGSGTTIYEWAPIGTIQSWSRKTLPAGWGLADGAVYAESSYPDACNVAAAEVAAGNSLWTVSGTTPGRTFTVPNLTDKFIYSRAVASMGATGGEATHVLTIAEMPSHSHSLPAAVVSNWTTGGNLGAAGTYNQGQQPVVTPSGGDQAHNNLPPYVVVAQIVKLSAVTATGSGAAEVNVSPAGPSPRVGELLWVDTDATDYGATFGVQRVTSLPLGPYDGQEVYYVADATNGILWHLRYNAASLSAYKWECVGGPRLRANLGVGVNLIGAAYSALATPLRILAPLAGEYEAQCALNSAGPTGGTVIQDMRMMCMGSEAVDDAMCIYNAWANANDAPSTGTLVSPVKVCIAPTAGAYINTLGKSGTTWSVGAPSMWICPVRVG